MSLRESFNGDVQRIHDQVDAVLDGDDGLLMLFDGERLVTYAHGFGVSASQLELLSVDLERAVNTLIGWRPVRGKPLGWTRGRHRRTRHDGVNGRSPASVAHAGGLPRRIA